MWTKVGSQEWDSIFKKQYMQLAMHLYEWKDDSCFLFCSFPFHKIVRRYSLIGMVFDGSIQFYRVSPVSISVLIGFQFIYWMQSDIINQSCDPDCEILVFDVHKSNANADLFFPVPWEFVPDNKVFSSQCQSLDRLFHCTILRCAVYLSDVETLTVGPWLIFTGFFEQTTLSLNQLIIIIFLNIDPFTVHRSH